MKGLWVILLTMVLFNGFLLSFSVFFEKSPQSSGLYNINDIAHNETFEAYKTPGVLNFNVVAVGFVGIGSLVLTGIMTFLSRDLKYIAAGALVALISTLWTATASIFSDMFNSFSDNPVLPSIFTMISVGIGIIVALLVLGIFTSQEQLQ